MKKSQLKSIIREAVKQVLNEQSTNCVQILATICDPQPGEATFEMGYPPQTMQWVNLQFSNGSTPQLGDFFRSTAVSQNGAVLNYQTTFEITTVGGQPTGTCVTRDQYPNCANSNTFIFGCTDSSNALYDPAATHNCDAPPIAPQTSWPDPNDPLTGYGIGGNTDTCNDACLGPQIPGCMDPTACNYDPNATVDDGSCSGYYGCTDPASVNYDPNAGCDDGSCIPCVYGCMDQNATNYDPNATCDDGTCTFTNGCTDPTACNYDPNAIVDDGSCFYPDGCTDPTACNYDPTAQCDDGSCQGLLGCIDPLALNYDPNATCDDGSCTYPGPVEGCADSTAVHCSQQPPALSNNVQCYDPNHEGCMNPQTGQPEIWDTDCCLYSDDTGHGYQGCKEPPNGCPPKSFWMGYPLCKCQFGKPAGPRTIPHLDNDRDREGDCETDILSMKPYDRGKCWVCHGDPTPGIPNQGSCIQLQSLPTNWHLQTGFPQGFAYYNNEQDCINAGPNCRIAPTSIPLKEGVQIKGKLLDKLRMTKLANIKKK